MHGHAQPQSQPCCCPQAPRSRYNDYRLANTFLYGNHRPVGGIFLLMLLTLGVNAALYRFRPERVLRAPELVVIFSMVLVSLCMTR